MKKRIAAVMVCLAIAAISISGTMAYFTADEIATNVITSSKLDIDLIEKDEFGNAFTEKKGIMPGDVVVKEVYIKNNNDSEDAYVRIKVTKTIQLAAGIQGEADLDYLTCNFNTTDWTEKDGYFYYNKAIKPGEETTKLFTEVTFSTGMGNMYQGCKAIIEVKAEAVQSKNNGNTVFDAAGWPKPVMVE